MPQHFKFKMLCIHWVKFVIRINDFKLFNHVIVRKKNQKLNIFIYSYLCTYNMVYLLFWHFVKIIYFTLFFLK